jgi:hypothetical protein
MFNNKDITSREQVLYLIFFSLFVLVLYGFNLSSDFIKSLEDDWGIYQNPYVQNFSFDSLKKVWRNDTHDVYYMPLTYTLVGCIVKIFGNNAFLFKMINLLLMIGIAWILFWISRLLQLNRKVTVLALCLFLLHPIITENIAWASSIRQTLSNFAGYLFLYYAIRMSLSEEVKTRHYILSILCLFASVSCKFSAIVFLPMAFSILLHRFVKEYNFRSAMIKGALLYSPHFLLAVFFYWMNTRSFGRNFLQDDLGYSYWQHFLIIVGSFGFYIKQILGGVLSFFYPISKPENFDYTTYFSSSIITFFLLAYLGISWVKNNKQVFFSILWYFMGLLPSALLVVLMSDLPMNTADRYFTYSAPWIFFLIAYFVIRFLNAFFLPVLFFVTLSFQAALIIRLAFGITCLRLLNTI